jgi:hypothetical protein
MNFTEHSVLYQARSWATASKRKAQDFYSIARSFFDGTVHDRYWQYNALVSRMGATKKELRTGESFSGPTDS